MEKLNSIIIESISEFSYIDVYLEKRKATLLFDDDKILILSNGTEYEDNLVMYSFFINRKHISSGIKEIREFINSFEKYLHKK
jgi:hypothetical protein|tara:strand:- start:34 stop:282 length:249 start_codon:yes stop_codon:yes gene_type:complete